QPRTGEDVWEGVVSITARSFHGLRLLIALVASAFLLQGTQASANTVASVAVQKDKDGAAHIMVNGVPAISLKTSNGTLSPSDRAD
ncbi:hypothetical protein C1T30_43285, partial [Bacillus sp. MBGLi97]